MASSLHWAVALFMLVVPFAAAGSLNDVEHIVVFMQENRAFNHYYGVLDGVRGFNDRAAPALPNGRSPLYQPTKATPPMPASQELCGCGLCSIKWTEAGADAKSLLMNQACARVADMLASAVPAIKLTNGELCSTALAQVREASLDHMKLGDMISGFTCESNVTVTGMPTTGGPVSVPTDDEDYMLPFPLQFTTTSATCMPAPAMAYPSDIGIFNDGRMDAWNTARAPGFGMSYFNRTDLPYYYALADSFAIGDQYYQSTFTATNPNRLHLFSGSNGLSVNASVNILDDSEPATGINWETLAETLEKANVSWKVYQQKDNFDDNALSWFENFRAAKPGSALYEKGQTIVDDLATALDEAMTADKLPQVSWIIAPTALSEHATNHPADGEDLTARLLKVVGDPKHAAVYRKTAFILNYDEGGQFVDALWPPTPPRNERDGKSTVSTVGEVTVKENHGVPAGHPIGLGFRVPLIIVSPWTRGRLVYSEISDHTSVIKFIEKRFGVHCPNISPWRRAVVSDLTAAFDFSAPDYSWPVLPDTRAYVNESRWQCEHLPGPTVPKKQFVPVQEAGTRVLRPLPYEFSVRDVVTQGQVSLTIASHLAGTGAFQVFDRLVAPASAPRKYTVEGGKSVADAWPVFPGTGAYELHVHGPNGFVRKLAGTRVATEAGVSVQLLHRVGAAGSPLEDHLELRFGVERAACALFRVVDNAYGARARTIDAAKLPGGVVRLSVAASHNWYDLTVSTTCGGATVAFARTFMGHMEARYPSRSDPAMGAARVPDTSEHPAIPESARHPERWSHEEMCKSTRSRQKDQCWEQLSKAHDEL